MFIAGILTASNGSMVVHWQDQQQSQTHISHSINLNIEKISLQVPARKGQIRVIGIIPNQLITEELIVQPLIKDGEVVSDIDNDILKLASIERHKNTGNAGLGFVKGMGLKEGAIAGSVGHDCHNITVIGTNDDDMLEAVRAVKRMDGGLVVVKDLATIAQLALPIGGLMSESDIFDVQGQMEKVVSTAKHLGSTLHDPFMHLGFLALEVIPKLKLTDLGLVDVDKFDFVPLWIG